MLQPLLMRSHWVFLIILHRAGGVWGGGSFQSQPATQLQVRLFFELGGGLILSVT